MITSDHIPRVMIPSLALSLERWKKGVERIVVDLKFLFLVACTRNRNWRRGKLASHDGKRLRLIILITLT